MHRSDNPAPSPARTGAGKGMQAAGLALLCALCVALLQWASGSRGSELGSHPDEAAHFVTGLMVRDYLASGFHQGPLSYAAAYYKHYPKIGLGVWPPFFYIVQAFWTLLMQPGIGAILTLMGLITGTLGFFFAWQVRREYGWPLGLVGALLLLSLPLVQQYANMVMAEMLSALLMFRATVYFARFLENGRWRPAMGFGLFAGLAILTKGTGLALALMPCFALAFSGRWSLLKNPRLWTAALLVAAIAGPWTWHFRDQGRGGWEEPSPSLHFTGHAVLFYGRQFLVASGLLLALLAVLGALGLFLPRRERPALAFCSLSLLLSIWVFQCLTPVGLEARHLAPAMPALVFLAMAGLAGLQQRWPAVRMALLILLPVLFFGLPMLLPRAQHPGYGSLGDALALSPFYIPHKEWHGFQPLASALAAGPSSGPFLISSDARGEGMFIASMALLDPHRPTTFTVQRASKTLAASTWSGGTYQLFYDTPPQVAASLAQAGVECVVTDASPAVPPAHEALLEAALALPGSPFRRVSATPVVRDGLPHPDAAHLYQLTARSVP